MLEAVAPPARRSLEPARRLLAELLQPPTASALAKLRMRLASAEPQLLDEVAALLERHAHDLTGGCALLSHTTRPSARTALAGGALPRATTAVALLHSSGGS